MKGKTLNSINTSIFFLRVIISRRNFFYFSQLFALNSLLPLFYIGKFIRENYM